MSSTTFTGEAPVVSSAAFVGDTPLAHMYPGDVYFFSPNSYVVCMPRANKQQQQQQQQQQQVPTKIASIELNPNASVFESKSPSIAFNALPPEWPEPSHVIRSSPSEVDEKRVDVEPKIGELVNKTEEVTRETVGEVLPALVDNSTIQASMTATSGSTSENTAMYPRPATSQASVGATNDDLSPLEGTVSDEQLRALLRTQLEYYFSRENLAGDTYLISQMDADQYVPIATIASFNQVKRLTRNYELIVEILRESANVQVDSKGEKVRPLIKRSILILREIPDETPIEEVKRLFDSDKCPVYINCEFAHNNSWYVAFETEEDAQKAYQYLREDVRTFKGKPIMARIKAKPLVRSSPFLPKNGFKSTSQFDGNDASYVTQPKYAPTSPPSFTPLANIQYVPGVPFFTANTTLAPQLWPPTSPTAVPFYDPGVAFAANGFTPAYAQVYQPSPRPVYPGSHNNRGNRGGKTYVGGGAREREAAYHDRHHHHHSEHNSQPQQQAAKESKSTVLSASDTPSQQQHPQPTQSSTSSSTSHQENNTRRSESTRDPPLHVNRERERKVNSYRGGGGGGPRRRRDDDVKRSHKEKPVPEFELETNSFPPLPGLRENQQTTDSNTHFNSYVETKPHHLSQKMKQRDIKIQTATECKEQDENKDPAHSASIHSTNINNSVNTVASHKVSRGTSTDVMQQLSLAGGRSDGDDNTKLDSNSKLSSTDKELNNAKMSYAKAALIGKERAEVAPSKKPEESNSQNDVIPEVNGIQMPSSTPASPPSGKRDLKQPKHSSSNGRPWKGRNNDIDQKVGRSQREIVESIELTEKE